MDGQPVWKKWLAVSCSNLRETLRSRYLQNMALRARPVYPLAQSWRVSIRVPVMPIYASNLTVIIISMTVTQLHAVSLGCTATCMQTNCSDTSEAPVI